MASTGLGHPAALSDRSAIWRTGLLCLLVTMFEGFDIQIMGVLAPWVRTDLGIQSVALGSVFSAATTGLLVGAVLAGYLADRIGRKPVLVASIGIFGLFTLATALVANTEQLIAIRFLTGLGLGGAMPSLVALTAEIGNQGRRISLVTYIFAGMPLGGGLSALCVALWPGEIAWRSVFLAGGILQLLLMIAIAALMPESRDYLGLKAARRNAKAEPAKAAKADSEAAAPPWTPAQLGGIAALCAAFFCTLLSLHFFLGWLPIMLTERGLAPIEAVYVSVAFGLAGAAGSIATGYWVDAGFGRVALFIAYAGVAVASIAPDLFGQGLAGAMAIGVLMGACLIGAQMALYGLAPQFFRAAMRGRGVGGTIAAGRLGSIAGPMLGGVLLASGWAADSVVAVNAPSALIAATSVIIALTLRGRMG